MSKICNYCHVEKSIEHFQWQKGKSIKCCKSCKNVKRKVCNEAKLNGSFKPFHDKEELLSKFKEVGTKIHSGLYKYDKVVYINAKTDVEIYCPNHDIYFWQTIGNHLAGKRCPSCAAEIRIKKKTYTTDKFVEIAKGIHGNNYDYSLVDYRHCQIPVQIKCNSCGVVFAQKPNQHLDNCGCPSCASYGYNKDKPGNIYVLTSGDITKIGITNNEVFKRVAILNRAGKNFEVIYSQHSEDGSIPYFTEWALKFYLSSFYEGVKEKFDGYTECFLGVDRDYLIKMIKQHFINMEASCGN